MKHINQNHIVINHKFDAVRVYDLSICPVRFSMKIMCRPPHQGSYQSDMSIIFQKINLWMRNSLDDLVILDPHTDLGEMIDAMSDCNRMFLPSTPDDNLLIQALDSKIKSLCENALEVIHMSLKSSDMFDCEQHWFGNQYLLESYQKKIIHKKPWWQRNDCHTADWFEDDLSQEDIKEILSLPDPLDELITSIQKAKEPQTEAEIIDLFNDPKS